MGTQRSDEPQNRQPGSGSGERGQTTLDFAIGISVFLAVLLFIFLFIPGILSPFTESAQDETVSSNRVADQLATGTLASPSDPYALDSYCTVTFFEGDATGCPFQNAPLEEQLGVATGNQRVNVSLRGNLTGAGQELLCWDSSEPDTGLVGSSSGECDTTGPTDDTVLSRGDALPDTEPSVTSVRVVSLDNRDVTLYVEMW
ncbi:DUF7287 family protein [Haloarcula laminariae]|uniref:DUF7287 family protein n=1 Tax=Haloarcula laminariae TaxID=2961577 RepID=UPI002404C3A2|nr:hypothetical protein [Halomicroarcula sp. FL173]